MIEHLTVNNMYFKSYAEQAALYLKKNKNNKYIDIKSLSGNHPDKSLSGERSIKIAS